MCPYKETGNFSKLCFKNFWQILKFLHQQQNSLGRWPLLVQNIFSICTFKKYFSTVLHDVSWLVNCPQQETLHNSMIVCTLIILHLVQWRGEEPGQPSAVLTTEWNRPPVKYLYIVHYMAQMCEAVKQIFVGEILSLFIKCWELYFSLRLTFSQLMFKHIRFIDFFDW